MKDTLPPSTQIHDMTHSMGVLKAGGSHGMAGKSVKLIHD